MAPAILKCIWMVLPALALLLVPSQAQLDALSCGTGDAGGVCDLLMRRLNDELNGSPVSITKDGIIYTFEDNTSERIETGHSCSVTAEIRSKTATGRIGTDIGLDLTGDAISDIFMLKLEVPIDISVSVRVKQRFGFRFFGSCSNTGSDSYTFHGDASTRAKIAIVVDINPNFRTTRLGNHELSIDPIVAVDIDVEDFGLDLTRVSGVSPLNAVATFIHGFGSTLVRIATAVFTGDSINDIFQSTKEIDLFVPVGFLVLHSPARQYLLDWLEERGERRVTRAAEGFELELEDELSAKVRGALGVEGTGKRSFIIDQNYQQILASGGSLDDVLVEPQSTEFCAWAFVSSSGRYGLYHPDVGTFWKRCTTYNLGEEIRSDGAVYVCTSSEVLETESAPYDYEPC